MERQAPTLALRFISGKYQGGEFPLGASPEVVVGRSSELDMVLAEDMVSRRHARILCSASEIAIEDLGSTNGTFVNGEKITRTTLKEGDRVLIGTSILKVVRLDPAAPMPRRDSSTTNAGRSTRTMGGSIDEIPLPDLLQLLGSSKKSGVLVVRSDNDVGRIHLRKGTVTFATINDLAVVPPLKSLFRILTWSHGSFELDAPDEQPRLNEISVGVQELLLDRTSADRRAEPDPGQDSESRRHVNGAAPARATSRAAHAERARRASDCPQSRPFCGSVEREPFERS